MDCLHLLAADEEFRKLNEQLNKKTERLMKEIDHAMQKPDIFKDFSHSLILNPNRKVKKHSCNSPGDSSSSLNTPADIKAHKSKIRDPKKCRRIHFETSNDDDSKNADIDSKSNTKCLKDANVMSNSCTKCSKSVKTVQDNDNLKTNNMQNICDEDAYNIVHNGLNIDNVIDNDNIDKVNDDTDANNDEIPQSVNTNMKYPCVCCNDDPKRDEGLEFLYAFVSHNVKDDVLPKSFLRANITVESVCKSLSSKIKLLQEQNEKFQSVINKKKTQCESHLTQLAEMESERMALLNKSNNMTTSVVAMKAKCMALQKRLEEKDRLYKEQRSEADKTSSAIKRLKSNNASVEAKCASQEAAIETLKQQLDVARRAEKEFKDCTRVLSASHESAISKLESQIKALTTRTEKQMALINNLRKQNAILTTEGALRALEKDYNEFLNQDFE
ncbi:hypothetical protein K1T71_014293 [Dendrolimus kikuchii]|uniref:Uncharacterized protein n=1 Tax=Dendrolimus kikuchii TaxID=765133 RepID=A0ACC1CFS8_9NEOP|nr:hypothetical protein K1T71_014293 [Dendrolimus kikuchii]